MLRNSYNIHSRDSDKRMPWFAAAGRALATVLAVSALVVIPAVGASAVESPSSVAPSASAAAGANNTGVPAGVALKKYYGDIRVTKDGTVLNGLEIFGLVRVEADNVKITNSIIRGRTVSSNSGLIYNMGTNLLVQDVELAPSKASPYINGIYGHHFTLRRVDIHNVIDSVHIFGDNVKVFSSWLHDNLHYTVDPAWNNKPSHDDNIQIQKGNNIWIAGNTIGGAHNAGMMITQGQGKTANVKFEGNRVSGGACSVNVAEAGAGTPIHGLVMRNNIFGTSNGNCNAIIDVSTRPYTQIYGNSRTDYRSLRVMWR